MRKLLTLFLALMATTATLFAESGTCGENVNWDLTGTVLTISGTGPMTDYESYESLPWVTNLTSITSVIIEDGVTTIGDYAFYYCYSMTSVTIPNSVTSIGSVAFYNCTRLAEITLPNNLASIGYGAFASCSALTAITLPASVTNIAEYAFVYCNNLGLIICEATTPPTLVSGAFYGINDDIPVLVPDEAVSAYKAADGWSDFTNIKGISSLGEEVTGTCGENVNWVLKDGVLTILGTGAMTDYESEDDVPWYSMRFFIKSVVVEDGVTTIGGYAFYGIKAMTAITISNSVTSIGSHAFYYCKALTEVTLPNSVTSIEEYAFSSCGVTSIFIPNSVTSIKQYAFAYCSALTEVTLPDGITTIGSRVFSNCSRLTEITIPNSVTTIGDDAFSSCGLTSITFPASIIDIGSYAFSDCSKLAEITCEATTPPTLRSNAFFYVKKSIPVYVHAESVAAYQAADGWSDFTNIQSIEDKAANQAAADNVIALIAAIGEVTLDSEAKIAEARAAYDALTDAQKALVTNYATLTAAEKAYADLKAQAEADQAAANVVINQIDAIGEVTLASEPAIVAARGAYNALTDAQKALVTNYATLTAAEAKLEILKTQAESDVAAAAAVTDLINGIGAISYTTESKALIDAAREAYNALTDAQKALVTNYATLVAAEQVYEQLKAEAEADQKAANVVIDLIDQIGEVTLASEEAINAARTAYNSLTSIQQELVTNYGTLLAAETTLELLKQQATIDQAMADDVIARIEAIGEVTYTNNCYSRIFDARTAYDALSDIQKALVTNYATLTAAEARYAELEAQAKAVEEAKTQLKALVSEAAELKAVAMLYSPASVEQIDAIIENAQQTINDPNATVEDVNAKTEIIRDEIQFVGAALLEEAKEQLRQSIKALYHSGDYPSWYAAVIIPALNQVDEIMWDNDKTVQENILFFQTTGKAIYDTAKAALEALRASDTREIVSSCEFTGFTDAITVGMMWNEAALNTLVANLNASAATQPYHFIAEECMLTKWDAEYELFVGVDHNEGVVLTPGDYQFVANISIDGEDAAKFRFPKASEATLSVTVDAAVWSVDLAGIVIDATYSSAYTVSPTFTLSEGQGFDETQDAQLKTQKIYHNGHFYILRGEHIYDIQGTLVR